jgi:hypothetical protein
MYVRYQNEYPLVECSGGAGSGGGIDGDSSNCNNNNNNNNIKNSRNNNNNNSGVGVGVGSSSSSCSGGDPIAKQVWDGLKSMYNNTKESGSDIGGGSGISTLELLNKTALALYLCYGAHIYDRFVRNIIEWTTTSNNNNATTTIISAPENVLVQIVQSGAKGTLEHLVEMEKLKECTDLNDYMSRSYTYLASFIHSSQELPQQGHLFYRYNAILNGLYCDEYGNLCLDGQVIIKKFCDNIPIQLMVDTDVLKLCMFNYITRDSSFSN